MDFLDQIVDERKKTDAAFATSWSTSELLLEVARIRKLKGLTQAVIAKRMGIPQPRVAEIERNPTKVSFGRVMEYMAAVGAKLTLEVSGPPENQSSSAA